MQILPDTKPLVNLKEYRLLEQDMKDTNMGDFEVAAQAIVTHYWLRHRVCLKDEVCALRMQRNATAQRRTLKLA